MGDLPERGGLESTADAVLGRPPDVDRVAMETARARAELRLFGASQPARIGRYEVEGPIAGGGMGMVYGAYDPQLQRRVALKVLHPRRNNDDRSQQRMILEARALAKLDHPNVVKVHDVLVDAGQVVVIMELLEGETLERWQGQGPRTWRETAAVYAQAGDGLAAAHGVDVIHRDFKPSNVVIGSDGRVRVVDFGLARLTASDDDQPAGDVRSADVELTATGDVLGTLGYSAPEQLEGLTATAASDQFSFCVSLHVAVEAVSPFRGSDPIERVASIQRGTILRATDGRHVPPWLRALLARGLSADPARRYPTMRDVVRELRRSRGWRRWRGSVLVAGALAVGIATPAIISAGKADETCDGGAAVVDGAWNTTLRDSLRRTIAAIGTPYAADVRERAIAAFDRYATEWQDTHRAVCRAHLHGEMPEHTFDRASLCLARRLGDLRAAVNALDKVDPTSLGNVVDVATAIPSVSTCADVELVEADVLPPETRALQAQVDAVRSQISSAEALGRAGRTELALTTLTQAREQARVTPYPPVQVEAALAEGRIRLAQFDLTGAKEALAAARTGAFEEQMLSAGLEASARLIYVEGKQSPQLDRLESQLAYLLPLSVGLRGDYVTRPLLLNNIGTVYLAAGRRADAHRYFEEAKAAIRRHDPDNLELTIVDLNLAMITADGPKRETLARSVWEKLRGALGEQHPSTLDALVTYAVYISDPAVAFEAMSRAAASYEQFHPTSRRLVALTEGKRAFLASELGDAARTVGLYQRAIDATTGQTDDDVVQWRRLSQGELALQLGNPRQAVELLKPVYDARIHSDHWWERADALRAQVGLGQAEAALGDRERAIRDLDAAIRDYPEILAINEEVEYRRYVARARHTLAHLLRDANREPARASALDQDAMAFYRGASSDSYHWILATP